MQPYKHLCPNCGKPTINYDPHKKAYCSKICEKNIKYGRKFVGGRQWQATPLKEE